MAQTFEIPGFQTFDKFRVLQRASDRAKKEKNTVTVMSNGRPFATVNKNGSVKFN